MSHSILLVDDDESLRALTGIILKHAGYGVYQARNGYEALEVLETVVPDLFMIDVMMPGMNGFELCQHIRAASPVKDCPIILLSARVDQASRQLGMESGANLYLTKPAEYEEILLHIKTLLKEAERIPAPSAAAQSS